jgi:ribulose kinase
VWAANVADSPNVFLTVTYENMGAMQQNAEQYQKMVAEMTKRFESNEEENQEISQRYEEYREIVDRKVLSRVQYK